MNKLRVGLVGLGRLGRVYARILAKQIPEIELVAVAGHIAPEIADEYKVPFYSLDRLALFHHSTVEAIVIASSTDTHVRFINEAFCTKKPTFCEKPLCLDLDMAKGLLKTQGDTYFQMGFMRRYDSGYIAAKKRMHDIGVPVLFKSTSRDQERTSIEYARTSGGMLLDMAIHDFDLARHFMGDVATVTAIGGAVVYPELGEIGDIDNAIVTLKFKSGKFGVIDISRNGAYGYDITTEIFGSCGTIRIGELRGSPISVMVRNSISHDTIPNFAIRFEQAFITQLRDFALNVLDGRLSPVTLRDGIEAQKIAEAALMSLRTLSTPVDISSW